MGKKEKYEGGSVPVTFRLPAKDLEKAKAGVENYLRRFEAGYDKTFGSFIDSILSKNERKIKDSDPEKGIDPLVFETLALDPEMSEARPEERIPGTLKKKGLGKGQQMRSEKNFDASRPVQYTCGCSDDGLFFRRDPLCRLDKDQHTRVVIKNSRI